MNAHDRLNAGRTVTHEGRFEEASAFAVHLVSRTRAGRGSLVPKNTLVIRMAYWLELAEKYPPAFASFRDSLNDKMARSHHREFSRDLFQGHRGNERVSWGNADG